MSKRLYGFEQKTGIIKYEIGILNMLRKNEDGTEKIIPIYMVVDVNDNVIRGIDGKPYASCVRKDVDRMKKNLEEENLQTIMLDQKVNELNRLRSANTGMYDSLFIKSH